jgi:hypothetical protein
VEDGAGHVRRHDGERGPVTKGLLETVWKEEVMDSSPGRKETVGNRCGSVEEKVSFKYVHKLGKI